MEVKDASSASSSPAVSRDGTPDEEWGTALAKDAASHFQSKRFVECAEVLDQILKKKAGDPTVLHNIAVTEFLCEGSSNPKKLLDNLDRLKLMPSINGNTSVPGLKGSGNNSPKHSTSCTAFDEEFDTSIITVNQAVIMYHLHEYTRARLLLEPLYQNLEPIDETTALRICLMLLDIALASQDASKAAEVILYLERALGVGLTTQGDSGSVPIQVPYQASKISMPSSSLTMLDANVSLTSANCNTSDHLPGGGDDSVEFEKFMSTLGSSNDTSERSLPVEISRTMDGFGAANDLKLELQLFKVRFLLFTQNPKAAKREIKHAMNMARGRDSTMALLLKSQMEFARGNYRKSVILLLTISNKPEPDFTSMLNNNLGCVYHRLGDHALSLLYFNKALQSCCINNDKQKQHGLFSQDKSLFIFGNCAMHYLACEKPLMAAKCLYKSSPVLSGRPILWLRLAECCIMAAKKGLLERSDGFGVDEAKIQVAGSGNCRYLLLETKSGHRLSDTLAQDGLIGNDQKCRLSFPFARQCLRTALYLLDSQEVKSARSTSVSAYEEDSRSEATSTGAMSPNQKSVDFRSSCAAATSAANVTPDAKGNKGNANTNASLLHSSVSAYEEILRDANRMIKQAVLADLAYVELCLENPLMALRAAEDLRELPGCSKLYIFLSCVYGAEALCHLNRLKDAAELLSVYLSDDNTVDLPFSDTTRAKWTSDGDSESMNSTTAPNVTTEGATQSIKPEDARGLVYVAFATMNAMKGDLKQAVWFVTKALSIIPKSPRALLAAVYLDVLLGKTGDALEKLRWCGHIRFHQS